MGLCSSYSHLVLVLKRLAKVLEEQLKSDAQNHPMKLTIDNFNKLIGVRDGSSIRQAYQNNSTGGYASSVRGMPHGMKMIPREWLQSGARRRLSPRDLRPSKEAFDYMRKFNEFYTVKILKDECPDLPVGDDEFQRPLVEVLKIQPTNIYPVELMDIEQQSIDGNLKGILKLLTEALGCTSEQLMTGLFLIGGDQLLVDRVRSIQLLRATDVPGEDFRFIVTLLGPFHTLMNKKKLIMRHHLGKANETGSLMSFNRVLKRDRKIDDQAKDLWACMDLTRDSLDSLLLGLLIAETGKEYATYTSFKADVISGEVDWRHLVKKMCLKFTYTYVRKLRIQDESKRDRVHENILLFSRQELEFRAFYTSMRKGDVGAMELLLQIWCPQFLAGQQTKYGNELFDIRCGMLAEWSKELKQVVRSNWVINPWGKTDKWLALDEMMEELVRALKEQFNPGGSDDQDKFTRETIARCIIYFMAIKDDMRRALGLRRRGGNHVKRDKKPDIRMLLNELLKNKIVFIVEGRGMPMSEEGTIGEVKDLYCNGLIRLVDGKYWRDMLLRTPGCDEAVEVLGDPGEFSSSSDED